MTKYDFRVILDGTIELTEDIADKLFESGCDDGTPMTCGGVFVIDFHRYAHDLDEAVRSAIANVKTAGYNVIRVKNNADLLLQIA